ncbi:MAG TPA: HAMP domain-containing sensor histidine kinase [Longimicrobiaceae bacterium]|nr:HAMP domain-containing sensor histidine kinase [Longimicrobiaceae bacterium]
MPLLRRPAARPPRSALVVGLLLLTLVLAGVLAYQAQDAARSHREAAESALRDYATFAGSEYAARVKGLLGEQVAYEALWPVMSSYDTLPFPSLDLLKTARKKALHAAVPVEAHFALDPESGDLRVVGDSIPARVRHWIVHSLAGHARRQYDPDWELGTAFTGQGTDRRMVFYTVKTDRRDGSAAIFGLTLDTRWLRGLFRKAWNGGPLLPRDLTRGLPNDSLVLVEVLADGGELFCSRHAYDPVLGAEVSLPPALGPVTVRTTLRKQAAGMLIIGGLPRDRLPLLLGLLFLTTSLIIAAIFQLRREYELARLRSEFVSSVSHELRTPLAQIRMFGETLLLGRVRSEQERQRSLEIIDQEARRLSHLVDNVLRYSRAERQKSRVDLCDVEVVPLVRQVVEAFTPLAAASATTLVVEAEEGVVARVDPEALRQVLLNLLDNAVKYGPRGQTVTVGAGCAGGWLWLRVEDEGPGIPPRERERVWEAFWRLERESASAVAGTGIGLAVVREIVTLHGGRTRVEDSPAGGARFVVEIPGARREPVAPAVMEEANFGEEVA